MCQGVQGILEPQESLRITKLLLDWEALLQIPFSNLTQNLNLE